MSREPNISSYWLREVVSRFAKDLHAGSDPKKICTTMFAVMLERAREAERERTNRHRSMEEKRTRLLALSTDNLFKMQECVAVASDATNVPKEAIMGRRRSRPVSRARRLAMWLAVETMRDLALADIGALFGMDHSTVLYARNELESERFKDTSYREWTDKALAKMAEAVK